MFYRGSVSNLLEILEVLLEVFGDIPVCDLKIEKLSSHLIMN